MIAVAGVLIPTVPDDVSEAAYRWPMWTAGGFAIVFTVVFTVLLVMSLLGRGNPKHDVARGVLILALGAGMILSGLAAAGLDSWTQDRYRDARSEYWQQVDAATENLDQQIYREYGVRVDLTDLELFLRYPEGSFPIKGEHDSGTVHDCMLHRSETAPPTLTVECDA